MNVSLCWVNVTNMDETLSASGSSEEGAAYFTVSTDPNTGVTYLEESSDENRNLRIPNSNGYPENSVTNADAGFTQELGSSGNDVTVLAVPNSSDDTAGPAPGVMTMSGYPISVIQWNPVQNAGTLYLVAGSAQTQSNSSSGGVAGGYQASTVQNVQYAPRVCDQNSMCLPANGSGTIFNKEPLSLGESMQAARCSTYYRIANRHSQRFQELPLNLSTTTISQPQSSIVPTSDHYGTHLQEFARFAVDQARDTPRAAAPSVISAVAVEVDPNVGPKQGIIQESFLQTNCHVTDVDSTIAVMCSETEGVLTGTDSGNKPLSDGSGISCGSLGSSIDISCSHTRDRGKIESGGGTELSKIRLMSTTAGAKTPIIREPPNVTRRINLSCLQNISSPAGCSNSTTISASTAVAGPVGDIGTRILQTLSDSSCKVISHSIVNITNKNASVEKTTTNFPMPVRPKPVLGFPTGNFIPVGNAGTSNIEAASGVSAAVYPVRSALPMTLPPLSVFKAPLRFVSPSVPLLPSTLPSSHHGSRQLPVIRTRVNRSRKSTSMQRGRRRRSTKDPSTKNETSLCDEENIQNDDFGLDEQGRDRVDLNARERERVSLLNDGFDTLRRVLPWSSKIGRRVSKVDTLRGAMAYIDFLQRLLEETEDATAFHPVSSGTMPKVTLFPYMLPLAKGALPAVSFGSYGDLRRYPYVIPCNRLPTAMAPYGYLAQAHLTTGLHFKAHIPTQPLPFHIPPTRPFRSGALFIQNCV